MKHCAQDFYAPETRKLIPALPCVMTVIERMCQPMPSRLHAKVKTWGWVKGKSEPWGMKYGKLPHAYTTHTPLHMHKPGNPLHISHGIVHEAKICGFFANLVT